MHRLLLTTLVPAAVVGLAGVAFAAVPGLSPLPQNLPADCAPLAHVPPSSEIPGPEISSHVSVANCLAETAMNAAKVAPDDRSIDRLDEATATSVAILDDVSDLGDPYWKMIAEDARRDIYVGMVVRARASITCPTMCAIEELEDKLTGWLGEAAEAKATVATLACTHPELQRDPVIAGIVQRDAAEQVATR